VSRNYIKVYYTMYNNIMWPLWPIILNKLILVNNNYFLILLYIEWDTVTIFIVCCSAACEWLGLIFGEWLQELC